MPRFLVSWAERRVRPQAWPREVGDRTACVGRRWRPYGRQRDGSRTIVLVVRRASLVCQTKTGVSLLIAELPRAPLGRARPTSVASARRPRPWAVAARTALEAPGVSACGPPSTPETLRGVPRRTGRPTRAVAHRTRVSAPSTLTAKAADISFPLHVPPRTGRCASLIERWCTARQVADRSMRRAGPRALSATDPCHV